MTERNTINFEVRNSVEGVNELFVERWSPRTFEPCEIPSDTLDRIVDAARWAPSCFNEQPWRFYLSQKESFDDYLALLVEANQAWAKNASVIGFLVGESTFARNGNHNDFFQLDCGAAWMSMTFQARLEGLYTHGMGGIKKAEIAKYLGLDDAKQTVLMGFVIGKLGDLSALSPEDLNKEAVTPRKALGEIWMAK